MVDNGVVAFPALLDYGAVGVFALTGALVAARGRHDIVTACFFAACTGIGGGTIRDLMLGAPVFWVRDAGYLATCIAAAGLVWAVGARAWSMPLLLWVDAVGMAAYSVVGAAKAALWGAPPLVAVVMGMITASFGGVVRDVLAQEPSILLRRELYMTPAALGATVFVGLRLVEVGTPIAATAGIAAAFLLRAGAIRFGWALPGFHHDP